MRNQDSPTDDTRASKSGLDRVLNQLINPCTRLLLRSPLHRLLSRTVMLVSVTGRKTGRIYTTPVNYVRDGNIVTAVSNRDRTWWRNIGAGAPVTLRIGAKDLSGKAEILRLDEESLASRLQAFYSRVSPLKLSRQKALGLASKKVVIQITCVPEASDA